MERFCLNTLSANEQCRTINEIVIVFRALLGCFRYLLPGLERNTVAVIYDWRLELRQLRAGEAFISSLGHLKAAIGDGRDLHRLWYIYTKNHMRVEASNKAMLVSIRSDATSIEANGELGADLMDACSGWLSLGGTALNESQSLEVRFSDGPTIRVANAFQLSFLQKLLPRFEASSKHRKERYVDGRGENVAPMPLPHEQAQELLLCSVAHGGDRLAYHRSSGKFYRFKPTRAEEQIFHGFIIEEGDVPASLRAKILGECEL